MKTKLFLAVLLGGTMLTSVAHAQSATTTPAPGTTATSNDTPVAEDPAADIVTPVAVPTPQESATQVEFLQAQLEAMQAQIDSLKKQMATAAPTWKGAPQFASDNGFTFKPKGFAQFDAGYVSIPGPNLSGTVGGLNYNNLGFNTRARRIVFGAEGTLPGGFGYKAEFNFAQGTVDYEDIVLTYQGSGSPIQVTVGNFYPLSSLETMTSSRLGSFLERTSFTDAFAYNRRIGVAVAYVDPADEFSVTGGLFSQEINNTNFQRTGWQASLRAVYSPQIGDFRVHLGGNFQHRVSPRDAQNVQYRTRPLTQVTDQRFVDTGLIAADGDDVVGIELAAINGPFHFAGEAQKLWVRGYEPGKTFGANNGVAGAAFYAGDPSFFSAYGEVGFYLTGETRGYKGGKWDRTKVLKPFDQGGMGAFQVNARVDYVDLRSRVAGATYVAPNFVNGGEQTGYQLSLIWNPMDYIRILAQYGRAHIDGGPRAATVVPTSTQVAADRSYDVDTFGVRAQVEF